MTTNTQLPSTDLIFGSEFEAMVEAKGDAPAVYHDGHWSSWNEWGEQSRAMAAAFLELGVKPGQVVALQLPNSWEFLVAHAAAALIGAVTFPIHMPYGPYELEKLLSRVDLAVLIVPTTYKGQDRSASAQKVLSQLSNIAKLVMVPSDPQSQVDNAISWSELMTTGDPSTLTAVKVNPETPLVYLASSGTTSNRPKICVHSHGAQLGISSLCAMETELSADDVLISASPFSNAFGISAIYMAVRTGLRQATLPIWNPHDLVDLAQASGATELFAVPTQLRDLLRTVKQSELSLNRVRSGGALAPTDLVRSIKTQFGADFLVQWGMTEIGAGAYTRPGDSEERVTQTTGRAHAQAEIAVLNPEGDPLPAHEVGELVYRSPLMMREYLGDQERTAEAIDTKGWLHTGDLAYLDSEGYIYYQGRTTDFINRGGMKFSAVEVESVLAEMPLLQQVAIVPIHDDRLGQRAVVAVVPNDGQQITLEDLTAYLEQRGLAKYKWPEQLVVLDEIPSTATGKIMRSKLSSAIAAE